MIVPDSRDALLREIWQLSQCPVAWDVYDRWVEPQEFFQWDWALLYRSRQAERESYWIEDPFDTGLLDPDGEPLERLRADLVNLRQHAPLAAQHYVRRSRRFWALRAVTPETHPKHFPPAHITWDEAVRRTRTGVSLVTHGIGPGQILEAFWTAITHLVEPNDESAWLNLRDRLFGSNVVRIAVSTVEVTGAAYGRESKDLCFELDASTPLVHAYPITVTEAVEIRGNLPAIRIQELDGFGDVRMREPNQRPFGAVRPRNEDAPLNHDG